MQSVRLLPHLRKNPSILPGLSISVIVSSCRVGSCLPSPSSSHPESILLGQIFSTRICDTGRGLIRSSSHFRDCCFLLLLTVVPLYSARYFLLVASDTASKACLLTAGIPRSSHRVANPSTAALPVRPARSSPNFNAITPPHCANLSVNRLTQHGWAAHPPRCQSKFCRVSRIMCIFAPSYSPVTKFLDRSLVASCSHTWCSGQFHHPVRLRFRLLE